MTRSSLQQMIRQDEIATFDGFIELDELLRVFPDVRWEEEGDYKRVQEIKEKAFGKRVFERALPDKEVLAERLFELGKEYAATKSLLLHYDRVFSWLDTKLDYLSDSEPAAADALESLKIWLDQQLDEAPEEAERGKALLAQESVMRVMSAHVTVQPSGHEFFVEGNDTILEAALRVGLPLDYGCSNGNCGDCRARLVSGQVQKVHPHDFHFNEADKANGHFLLCSYTAVTDIVIEANVTGAEDIPPQHIQARVKWVEEISDQIRALHLTTPRSQRLRFLAGQSVTLSVDGVSGEYFVASCPCEDRQLTLHIRRDNRPFSRKVFNDLAKEDTVTIDGPHGSFVYEMESRRPVIFVAWDDGFAPIKSLVQHAMSLEQAETMHLYWVAEQVGQYRDNLCRSWADAYDNFYYRPLGLKEGVAGAVAAMLAEHPDLSGHDVYAVGPAEFLYAVRDGCMSRNLPPAQWHGKQML
jgi:CDP-4-dehydro-6-deoxyglucose reductase